MKRARLLIIVVGLLAVSVAVWAAGANEAQVQGPPYDVQTVMRILESDQLYQGGYLQREVDQNGDGLSDETGQGIYQGALRDFRDANNDGLDDSTGTVLPLGLQNRLVDRNGDGIVDGTTEPVGQYVNRVRVEAQLRYEQGDGEGDQVQTRTRTQTQTHEQTQTSSGTQSQSQSQSQSGSGGSSVRQNAKSGRSQ